MAKCLMCQLREKGFDEMIDYLNWMAEHYPEMHEKMMKEYEPTDWLKKKWTSEEI